MIRRRNFWDQKEIAKLVFMLPHVLLKNFSLTPTEVPMKLSNSLSCERVKGSLDQICCKHFTNHLLFINNWDAATQHSHTFDREERPFHIFQVIPHSLSFSCSHFIYITESLAQLVFDSCKESLRFILCLARCSFIITSHTQLDA